MSTSDEDEFFDLDPEDNSGCSNFSKLCLFYAISFLLILFKVQWIMNPEERIFVPDMNPIHWK